MSTDRVECLDCGEELTPSTKTCPNCGSTKKHFYKFVNEKIRLHEGTKLKAKDKTGKVKRKVVTREKTSKHDKEAKETLDIDIAGNRKRHHVEEQNEKGNWTTVHDEDEPLKKSHKNKK
jgi:predicted metalloprotease